MHDGQQDMLFFAQAEQAGPQQRALGQIEGTLRFLSRYLMHPHLLLSFGQRLQIDAGKMYLQRRCHLLNGLRSLYLEKGAENLVTSDNLIDALLERLPIKLPSQTKSEWNRVD